jgi:peptide/nickel transport system permease protein
VSLEQAAPTDSRRRTVAIVGPGRPARIGRVAARFFTAKGVIASVLVLVVVIPSALAPWVAPYSPLKPDIIHRFAAPNLAHLFGTDALGRDLFTRCLYGAQLSLIAAAALVFLALAVGVPLGIIAGYHGGGLDNVIMRVIDIFLAFPALILAMSIAAALGPSLTNATIALAVVFWPAFARVARGQVLSTKQNLYVEAARSVGVPTRVILWKHILPNSIQPVIVLAALDVSGAILSIAGLSFIGLGAHPPTPELGVIINENQTQLLNYPWIEILPGIMMFCVALGMNLLADVIQDVLNPRRARGQS